MDALEGKTALITGATSGIGFYTAAALARLGASVLVTGRDPARGAAAQAALRARAGHDRVWFLRADASTVGGNLLLGRRLLAELDRLDVLVNNVGGQFNDRRETDDGYEATLAVNAIGPFALTETLRPLLRRSAPARIVNVASAGHAMWKGDPFADLQMTQDYLSSAAYARAKLLEILWTFALARRLEGTGIVANALHPGLSWTPMTRGMSARSMPAWVRPAWPLLRLLQRLGSAERNARTSIYLASAPEAEHTSGRYFGPKARAVAPAPAALDDALQERAWDVLATLVRDAPTASLGAEEGAANASRLENPAGLV